MQSFSVYHPTLAGIGAVILSRDPPLTVPATEPFAPTEPPVSKLSMELLWRRPRPLGLLLFGLRGACAVGLSTKEPGPETGESKSLLLSAVVGVVAAPITVRATESWAGREEKKFSEAEAMSLFALSEFPP